MVVWVGVPALIIVLFSTFTTTFLDIYSTAISGLNILPKLGEKAGVLIGGILGTATALVFPSILDYEHFLLFIGAMFCPLFGIVLVDYFFLRRRTLIVEDLYKGRPILVPSRSEPHGDSCVEHGVHHLPGFFSDAAGKILGSGRLSGPGSSPAWYLPGWSTGWSAARSEFG
jgi:purine-cytosine permease-like protein